MTQDTPAMITFREHLRRVQAGLPELDAATLEDRLAADPGLLLIDVRQRDEVADGAIPGALPIPFGLLELELPRRCPDLHAELILCCAGGARSALAARNVQRLGYTRVRSLAGGFDAWKQRGAPFDLPHLPALPPEPEADAPAPEAPSLSVAQLQTLLTSPIPPHLLDLREEEELIAGTLEGAAALPRGRLAMRIEALTADRSAPLILLSSRGVRAAWAVEELRALGYTAVFALEGGLAAWQAAGLPLVHPRRLSAEERSRYSRHLLIPEVGEAGQLRLLQSRVLLVGAGGLGSPAAYYLAAAGVGTLGIIDSDVVDRSNLQRQILHTDDRVGTPKVESARQTLQGLNPGVQIVAWNARLTAENVDAIFNEGWDLVLDGGDNFPTRYLVNDACIQHNITCIHGSIYRFEGQVTVFKPRLGPCYRCLYPTPPPPELAPSCAEAGVLGVLPGLIGLLQATEALKLLLGIGEDLSGRLLHLDALPMKLRELKLRRDPSCPVCGDSAVWRGYSQDAHTCALPLQPLNPAEERT